jgi:hypothetical protein
VLLIIFEAQPDAMPQIAALRQRERPALHSSCNRALALLHTTFVQAFSPFCTCGLHAALLTKLSYLQA